MTRRPDQSCPVMSENAPVRWMWSTVAVALLVGGAASAGSPNRHGGRDTIGAGRPVACVIDAPPRRQCTFYPRNRDGSFVLESRADGGRLYYATRTGANTMRFELSEGGRASVDLGVFARSRDDRACWVRRDRRICAW